MEWRRFFSKEPKKVEGPVELTPGETPSFRFSAEEIKAMKDQGMTDAEIEVKRNEAEDRLIANALVKKMPSSQ